MKLSSQIKKHFNNLNIPVKVRTVACKHPFVQVWIESADRGIGHDNNIVFPLEMRKKLLSIIYGPDFQNDGAAGNVQKYSISVNEREWNLLIVALANSHK